MTIGHFKVWQERLNLPVDGHSSMWQRGWERERGSAWEREREEENIDRHNVRSCENLVAQTLWKLQATGLPVA